MADKGLVQSPMAASYGSAAPQDAATQRQGSTHADRLNIWLADLESIRREQPVVSPSLFGTQRVISQPRRTTGPGRARSASQAEPEVVVLDDDGGSGGGAAIQGGSPSRVRAFYGLQGVSPNKAGDMLRYQDQSLGWQGKFPSRSNGLGFNMVQLRFNTGWVNPVRATQDVQPVWDHATFMQHPPLGFDQAVSVNWARDASPGSLLYGFPMLGDVIMYRAMNYGGARSTCFFKALAYLVYGDQSLYHRVQAEHLQHYGDVLEWDDHPRHQMYTAMNQSFHQTTISTRDSGSGRGSVVETVANFFQLLSIPQAWMPLDMLDVTADIYNLFIVVYTINESNPARPVITEVNVKGSYNARHVFLLFNGFHYQPMVPNEFLASEFTFPRPTYENVKGLPWSRDTDRGRGSIDLRWRTTWGAILDRGKGALPVDHVFYRDSLRVAITGSYS